MWQGPQCSDLRNKRMCVVCTSLCCTHPLHWHLVIGLGTRETSVLTPYPCHTIHTITSGPASLPTKQVLTFFILPGCSASQACTILLSSSTLSVSLLTSKCSLSCRYSLTSMEEQKYGCLTYTCCSDYPQCPVGFGGVNLQKSFVLVSWVMVGGHLSPVRN